MKGNKTQTERNTRRKKKERKENTKKIWYLKQATTTSTHRNFHRDIIPSIKDPTTDSFVKLSYETKDAHCTVSIICTNFKSNV